MVVSCHMLVVLLLALIADSYQLMIVGSALQSLSLFMLSLAKPGQFYLVSRPGNSADGLLICGD
jgi:hypothetical protein